MRRFLILAAVFVTLSVGLLYVLPRYLKQQEIAAAQADLTLLQTPEPAPAPGLRDGYAALLLLAYDVPASEHPRLLATYGRGLLDWEHPPAELQPYRIADIRYITETAPWRCPGEELAECVADVRARLLHYQTELAKQQALLRNVNALADYETLSSPFWPDEQQNFANHFIVPMTPIMAAQTAVISTWAQQGGAAALPLACRQIRTGRLLLQARPGLVYPMLGSAVMRRHIDIAAAILAEQPALAQQLPADCATAFGLLTEQEVSLCRVFKDEFELADNTIHQAYQEMKEPADQLGLWLPDNLLDREHTRARMAPAFSAYCRSEARAKLAQDQRWPDPEPPSPSLKQRWACIGNPAGCNLVAAQALSEYGGDYVRRMQDTQMRLHALQAALALYRLPPAQRSEAAVAEVLRQHSTPQRPLTWDAAAGRLNFTQYSNRIQQARYPSYLPVGKW